MDSITSPKPSPEMLAMLASMGLRHPSQGTDAERGEATAQLHDRFARAFTEVGNERDAAAARKGARIARGA